MIAFTIALILASQGIPVSPNQGGAVSGVLKTAAGTPAVGVRVAAVARPDPAQDAAAGAAMAGLAETDEMGRFQLENIPPGYYYIAAGRLDMQTYYPGVLQMSSATVIRITPGSALSDISFVMQGSSSGRSPVSLFSFGIAPPAAAVLRMKVTVEGNAKIPVFSNRGFAGLVFSRVGGSVRTNATLDQTSVSLPGPPVGPTGSDYKVSVENLPDSYSIKSIGYGSTDLRSGDLHIPAAYFNAPSGSPPPSGTPLNTINLVLRMVRTDDPSGVRVSGRVNNFRTPRSIYISGNPGSLYSDGTFEFRGVPPGRHVILTGNNPSSARPVGAMIVVGNGDVTGVLLEEMLLLPPDFKTPTAPVPDARAPGTIIHLASVHGRVIEETTQQPIADGILYVGEYLGVQERAVMRLPSDGRFEISHLLPGSYKLEILVFGHTTIRQTFEVDEKDVDLELTSRKLY